MSELGARIDAVRSGAAAAAAATGASLSAIDAAERGPHPLHAFLAVDSAAALAAAQAVDGTRDRGGEPGPLAGVTLAVKDNLCTLGLPTTCGSRMLEDYHSPFEATAVRRLRDAGAIVVGKTNLDEFGMGSSTEHSAFGPTLNPHDATRVPGGSSGGSAAAVAAGLVDVALGSDTGGSVRQPAAFCGVVGMKPTYGRVSRYGLVAFASSLDQVGVLGSRVEDAARVLQAMAGPDARDSTAAPRPVPDLLKALRVEARGMVVGVPREYTSDAVHAQVRNRVREAADRLREAGLDVRTVSLPHTDYAVPAYCVIAAAEASSNLARYDGVRYGFRAPAADSTSAVYLETRARGFGDEARRRIVLGTYVLSAGYHDRYYQQAQRARAHIARDFDRVFRAGVDVIFTPTTPTPAFRFGERVGDPYAMYLSDAFTVTANLAGIPALSLPIGCAGRLPVGGQLMGRAWDEAAVLRVAAALERSLGTEP